MSNLAAFERTLGHTFARKELLLRALTHSSLTAETGEPHNETLEFLGDAVVDLAVARMLIEAHPTAGEGELSRRRSALVNEAALARVAEAWHLGRHLRLGKGERRTRGHEKRSLLADAVEAVFGAVFLDSGYEAAEALVRQWLPRVASGALGDELIHGDPKSRLQEWAQNRQLPLPVYEVEAESGPPHARTYQIVVRVGGEVKGRGVGRTKKEAERQAATEALEKVLEAHDA